MGYSHYDQQPDIPQFEQEAAYSDQYEQHDHFQQYYADPSAPGPSQLAPKEQTRQQYSHDERYAIISGYYAWVENLDNPNVKSAKHKPERNRVIKNMLDDIWVRAPRLKQTITDLGKVRNDMLNRSAVFFWFCDLHTMTLSWN